jgi:hypothetical protein
MNLCEYGCQNIPVILELIGCYKLLSKGTRKSSQCSSDELTPSCQKLDCSQLQISVYFCLRKEPLSRLLFLSVT